MIDHEQNRRELIGLTLSLATAATLGGALAAEAQPPPRADLIPQGAGALKSLAADLARAPRRRDFKTTPMILTEPSQWDASALSLLLAYPGQPKQVWDNTEIDSPWLNLMRNSMNAQIWSFRHADFIAVSATHGTAHLALFDQAMWDKYGFAKMSGGKMTSNSLIVDAGLSGSAADYQNPTGLFSPEGGDSIPVLMRRGVVFLGCHNAIWEVSGKLIKAGANRDKLSHEQLAAELTNHLIPGAVLTPGVVSTIPELQRAGYLYIK